MKSIYWITTNDKHEDWFVVGLDQYVAKLFFIENEGYDMDCISSEEICIAEFEDEESIRNEAYFPSHEMLIKNGFEIICENEPRVFWKNGKKYCQGNIVHSIIAQISDKQSGVYIVAIQESNLYKIGVTKDLKKRLSQLQTSNPYEFYLINFFITNRSKELEKLLHEKFKKYNYKREWFKLEEKEISEVCQIACEFIGKQYRTSFFDNLVQLNEPNGQIYNQHCNDNDLPF